MSKRFLIAALVALASCKAAFSIPVGSEPPFAQIPFLAPYGSAAQTPVARAGATISPRDFCSNCGDGNAHSVSSVLGISTLAGLAAYSANGVTPFAFVAAYPYGTLFNLTPEINATGGQTTLTFQGTATLGVQIDVTAAVSSGASSFTVGDLSVTDDATPIVAGTPISGAGIPGGTTVSATPTGSAGAWTIGPSANTTAAIASGSYLTFGVRPAIGSYTLPVISTTGINQDDVVTAASGCIPAGTRVSYYNAMKGEIHLSKATTGLCAAADTLTFTPAWLANVAAGMTVTGPTGAIPANTTVSAVNPSTGVVTLSAALTGPIYANASMLSYWALGTGGAYNFQTPVTFYAPYTDAQAASLSMDRLAIQACLNLANGGIASGAGGDCKAPIGSQWLIDGTILLPTYSSVPNNGALVAFGGDRGSRWGGAILEVTQDLGPGNAAIACGDPSATVSNQRGMYAGTTGYYCTGKLHDLRLAPSVAFTNAYGSRPQWGGVPVAMDGLFQGARLDTEGVLIEGFNRGIRFIGDQTNWADTYANGNFFGLYFDALGPNLHSDYRATQLRAIGNGWAGVGIEARAYVDHAVLDKGNFTFNAYGVWCDPSPVGSTCLSASNFLNVNAESNGCGWVKDGGIRDGVMGEGYGRNVTSTVFDRTLANYASGSAIRGGCSWTAYYDVDKAIGLDIVGVDANYFPVVSGATAIVRADRLGNVTNGSEFGGVKMSGPGTWAILQAQSAANQGMVDGMGLFTGDFCFTDSWAQVRIEGPTFSATEVPTNFGLPALGVGLERGTSSLCNGGNAVRAGTTPGAAFIGVSAQGWAANPQTGGHYDAVVTSGINVPFLTVASSGAIGQPLKFAGTSSPGAAISAANATDSAVGECLQAWTGTRCWGPLLSAPNGVAAGAGAYTATGGSISIAPVDRSAIITDVSDYAACSGGDDTAGVAAAFAYAATHGKRIRFSKTQCNVCPPSTATPIYTAVGNNWDISGVGEAATVNMTCDGELVRFDLSTYSANNVSIHDIRVISTLGSGNQTNTNVFRFYCNSPGNSSCQGASYIDFRNIYVSGVYRVAKFDETSYNLWNGTYQIQNYAYLRFVGLVSDYSTGVIPYEMVHFDSGPGAHGSYINGTWNASNAGLMMGNGTSGLGDQLVEGIHFTNGAYGVYINGPSDLTRYRDNFTIIGNQFDGITTNTVYATNLENSRLDNNNSTASVGYSLAGCSWNQLIDRNYMGTQNATLNQGFAAGTASIGLFDILRVPVGNSGSLYSAVRVQVFVTGLVGTVGDVELDDDFIVEFSGANGTTVRTISANVVGLGASYVSLLVSQYGTDRARATLTMTGTPSTNTATAYVVITGNAGRFQLVTGS